MYIVTFIQGIVAQFISFFSFICIINLFIVMHELAPYCTHKTNSDDGRLVASLADLLNSCLALDPKDRITVVDAYNHSFFTQKD